VRPDLARLGETLHAVLDDMCDRLSMLPPEGEDLASQGCKGRLGKMDATQK
jgi:hypothetical protein